MTSYRDERHHSMHLEGLTTNSVIAGSITLGILAGYATGPDAYHGEPP